METLNSIYKQVGGQFTQDEIKQVNLRLLLLAQLSSLQINIAQEIEWMFKEKGVYKMTIKHNHEKIKNLLRNNSNKDFWNLLTEKQVDEFCNDADTLESLIYKWAGLK